MMDNGETDRSIFKLYDAGGSGLQFFEKVAAELIETVDKAQVDRVRDVIQIRCEPEDIGPVILVTPEAVEFRLPTLNWMVIPIETSCLWRRVLHDETPREDLKKLIALARTTRRKQFRTCRHCGRKVPPERRHGADVCHGCAERHLGIVH